MTFTETQRFKQWWLWAILLSIAAVATLGIYRQVIMDEPFGDNPMSDTGLIVFAVLMYLLPILFLFVRLKSKIDKETIELQFVPFMKKSVNWTDIATAEVVDYGFLGGWGVYHSSEHGTVYATGGKHGLAIKTKKGQKFVIGTRKESEMKTFLENLDGNSDN